MVMRYKKVVVALLIFHMIDVITTIVFVNFGLGVEDNPIARWYMNYFGTISGVLIKFLTIDLIIIWFFYHLSKKVADWKKECKNAVDRFCLKLMKKVTPLEFVLTGQVVVVFWNLSLIVF